MSGICSRHRHHEIGCKLCDAIPPSLSNDLLDSCTWSQEDEDSDGWETDCGYNFEIYEGTPAENNMKFCCYCGKRLITELYKERT